VSKRLGMAMTIIVGSWLLYCGNNAARVGLNSIDAGEGDALLGGGTHPSDGPSDGMLAHDGFVGDALAGGGSSGGAGGGCGCGTTFTKIWEGDIQRGALSPTFAVGAYSQLVLYANSVTSTSPPACGKPGLYPLFQVDTSPFGSTNQMINVQPPVTSGAPTYGGGHITVDGPNMQLLYANDPACSSNANSAVSIHVVLAGIATM
jgi:hypothetical protein